jgi:hypothetical protein
METNVHSFLRPRNRRALAFRESSHNEDFDPGVSDPLGPLNNYLIIKATGDFRGLICAGGCGRHMEGDLAPVECGNAATESG